MLIGASLPGSGNNPTNENIMSRLTYQYECNSPVASTPAAGMRKWFAPLRQILLVAASLILTCGTPAMASFQGTGGTADRSSAGTVKNRGEIYTVAAHEEPDCTNVVEFVPALPEFPIDIMVFLSENFYFDLNVLNAPSGPTVSNGFYGAWCVKFDFPIETNKVYQGTLHYSYGHGVPLHMELFDWPRINYILNHKGGASAEDIQTAIWYFSGQPAGEPLVLNGVAQALVDDAMANGQCFVPGSCDRFAVIIDTGESSGIQWLILETVMPSNPAIVVTKLCGPAPTVAGGVQTFAGTVTNTGDITLTNVFVFDDQPAPQTWILGPITLAPGEGTNFSGSYSVPGITNIFTNLVTTFETNTFDVVTTNIVLLLMTNSVPVLATNTVVELTTNSVPVLTTNVVNVTVTNNTLTVTTNGTAPFFGTINPVTEGVVDRFSVPANLNGLTYADEDKGYGATQFYSIREDSDASYFATITAGTALVTDRFDASSRVFDSLTFAAPDVGYGPVIFYSLSHDNAGVSSFGTIKPGGAVGVVEDQFVAGNDFDSITFSATDVGYGANLFYYVRHDVSGASFFGTINPAQPGTITDRFSVGNNVDSLVFSATDVGYGANNFYYLRHDSDGVSTFGTILVTGLNTGTVTDRFEVGNHAHELTFTTTDTGFGANLFYFLREGTNFSTNTVTTYTTNSTDVVETNFVDNVTTNNVDVVSTNYVDVVSTNSVPVISTNSYPEITTNIVSVVTTNTLPGISTNTVTASGTDTCQGNIVTATATCTGSIEPVPPIIGGPGVPPPTFINGTFGLSFATEMGVSYTVQHKTTLSDPWTNLPGMPVIGNGGVITVMDSAAGQPSGFYQVVLTP